MVATNRLEEIPLSELEAFLGEKLMVFEGEVDIGDPLKTYSGKLITDERGYCIEVEDVDFTGCRRIEKGNLVGIPYKSHLRLRRIK